MPQPALTAADHAVITREMARAAAVFDSSDELQSAFADPLVSPDAKKAILAEVKKHGHDLIVMGVGRRPGDKLFFGDTAAAVFEKAPASIVFLAS